MVEIENVIAVLPSYSAVLVAGLGTGKSFRLLTPQIKASHDGNGFSDDMVRTITENGRQLKIRSASGRRTSRVPGSSQQYQA